MSRTEEFNRRKDVARAYFAEVEEGRIGWRDVSEQTGIPVSSLRRAKAAVEKEGIEPPKPQGELRETPVRQKPETHVDDDANRLLLFLQRKKDEAFTLTSLCDVIDRGPAAVRELLGGLKKAGYNIYLDGEHVSLTRADEPQDTSAEESPPSGVIRFGIVSDTHLCCKAARLDVLDTLYDWYAEEGVDTVYHAGNIIEGDARFNVTERTHHGLDSQVEYLIERYPQRDNLTTRFITGDDHEGWYQKDVGISIGRHIEQMALSAGREDLEYLGFLEHDIEFKNKAGSFVMKVMHPGGGSSYALSYTPQKIVESFGPREKPGLLIIGHYHKLEYLPALRGVHVIQAGCTMDQTVFLRKKRISCHVGGWLVTIHQCPKSGAIERLLPEVRTFYDREFHQNFERY